MKVFIFMDKCPIRFRFKCLSRENCENYRETSLTPLVPTCAVLPRELGVTN